MVGLSPATIGYIMCHLLILTLLLNNRHFYIFVQTSSTCHVQLASHLNKGTAKSRYGIFQSSIRSCPLKQTPVMHIFTKEAIVPLPEDGLKRR